MRRPGRLSPPQLMPTSVPLGGTLILALSTHDGTLTASVKTAKTYIADLWWQVRFIMAARLLQFTVWVAPEGSYKEDFMAAIWDLNQESEEAAHVQNGSYLAHEDRMETFERVGGEEEVLAIFASLLQPELLPKQRLSKEHHIILHRSSGEVVTCSLHDAFKDDDTGNTVYIFAGKTDGDDISVLVSQPALN